MKVLGKITITPGGAVLNGQTLQQPQGEGDFLVQLYRGQCNDYPKFFKMDPLCRLGFLAAEILLKPLPETHPDDLLLFSSNGSIVSDRRHQETISDPHNFFPSPAVFVYTLPNIVCGEIAIRHHITGETSCFLLPAADWQRMHRMAEIALQENGSSTALVGWLDHNGADDYLIDLELFKN